jgi:hypothetical protein
MLTIEFISETLTDDSYFTIVPPIIERLLQMQSHPSFSVRAKALSVFRACIEQMEMYKDTNTYRQTVYSFIESIVDPWIHALDGNLRINVDHFDETVVRLTHATYKVIKFRIY